jgi:hypothetical protein
LELLLKICLVASHQLIDLLLISHENECWCGPYVKLCYQFLMRCIKMTFSFNIGSKVKIMKRQNSEHLYTGSSSTSTDTKTRSECFKDSSAYAGAAILHGPHHTALNFTTSCADEKFQHG